MPNTPGSRPNPPVSHYSDPIQPKPSKFKRFGFGGLCFLVALICFGVQQGCSVLSPDPSWIAALLWFSVVMILVIMGIWLWDQTARHHWVTRGVLTVVAVLLIGLASYSPIKRQYLAEHPHLAQPTTAATPISTAAASAAPAAPNTTARAGANSAKKTTHKTTSKASSPSMEQNGGSNNTQIGTISQGSGSTLQIDNNEPSQPSLPVNSIVDNEGGTIGTLTIRNSDATALPSSTAEVLNNKHGQISKADVQDSRANPPVVPTALFSPQPTPSGNGFHISNGVACDTKGIFKQSGPSANVAPTNVDMSGVHLNNPTACNWAHFLDALGSQGNRAAFLEKWKTTQQTEWAMLPEETRRKYSKELDDIIIKLQGPYDYWQVIGNPPSFEVKQPE